MTVVWVGLGGAIGAVLRYLSVGLAARAFGTGFPVGTLAVNIVGSFLMGIAAAYLLGRLGERPLAMIMPGVLGGFTTFSAFSLDAVRLFEDGRAGASVLYIMASVLLAILALLAGLWLGRSLT